MLKQDSTFNVNQASYSGFYEFEQLPRFPKSLFMLSEYKYNGALKALSAFFLLVAALYFLSNFWEILVGHMPNYAGKLPNSSGLQQFISAIWQLLISIPEMIKILILMIPLILSYLVAWIIFETRTVAQYALGIVNVVSGGMYVLDPLDAIPDFLPIVGKLDDAFFGIGWAFFGAVIFLQAIARAKETENTLQLINEHNEAAALQMLLRDKGIQVRKSQQL